MSGPIRRSIGLTHKRLTNYIETYKITVGKTTQPLDEIDNSSLIILYGELKLHLNKIEKTISYLESIHQSWIHFITSLTSDNERIREIRIYDDFLKEYSDYTVTLETAKDTIDEINNLKKSYKSELLARKEEDNLSQDDFSSVKETPIMTATYSAPSAQSAANSTLAYLPPVTIPPFYGDITK
uniref:Uncharacterized protein n=1 Tax=Heterorhabditis bacteriophora TaxID=37862 RepID=A0A1I7WVW6_HETBA